MPPSTRAFFEASLGHDLGHVRIHTGGAAAIAAQTYSARAFTVGRDIAFAPGQYAPDTSPGRWVLAHELTHVLQQSPRSAPTYRTAAAQADAGISPPSHSPSLYVARIPAADCAKLSQASCNGVIMCGNGGHCWWGGPKYGCRCIGQSHRSIEDVLPAWLLALLTAAALALLIACFATGVCEAGAIVGAVGTATAAIIIALLQAAGIEVRGAETATGTSAPYEESMAA